MKAQIKLGRVFGIEIGLHYSWAVIALLITFSLGRYFRETNPQWGARVIWISATVAGLLFFSSILAHEMAHSLVAKAHAILRSRLPRQTSFCSLRSSLFFIWWFHSPESGWGQRFFMELEPPKLTGIK